MALPLVAIGAGVNILTGLAGLFGKKKSAPAYVPPPAPTKAEVDKTMSDLMAYADRGDDRLREQTLSDIEKQMQRRGLRTSGIHARAMEDAAGEISEASAAARQGMALEVFKAKTAAELGQAQLAQQAQYQANLQSQWNQEQRGQAWESIGGFIGEASMPWLQQQLPNWLGGTKKAATGLQSFQLPSGLSQQSYNSALGNTNWMSSNR